MLDEFPALGRLDFFESALAFKAGYGLKAFLIAQSLNQIEKAYGQSNAILDNCHVRVSFATNDERTTRRVSDALGTATEMRAMKNYAGHRLSPWLGQLMVSRSETPRPLLTPGEIMQLPPDEEIVMVSGLAPIRASKARYFADPQLRARVLSPPADGVTEQTSRPDDDWSALTVRPAIVEPSSPSDGQRTEQTGAADANAGIRREPDLGAHEDIAPAPTRSEFDFDLDDSEEDAVTARRTADRMMTRNARNASLDPDDGIEL